MCLNLSLFARKNTAKSDIEVAKVLIVPRTDDNRYDSQPCTPFQRFPIEFNKLYTSELVRKGWTIEDGLHSYADLADAYYVAHLMSSLYRMKVFKAIIPKGSFYYFGKHSYVGASYASNQLIITDEILC